MYSKVKLSIPPFNFEIESDIPFVINNIGLMYGFASISLDEIQTDYFVKILKSKGLRRFIKPQASFFLDQQEPFQPLQLQQAYALLEWGMNWCIASNELQYVIIHAAVLAKGDKAILFPAPPGSGKSTLTAYLAYNGWRLLSDEMALIIPYTKKVQPFVRPICLKNRSIELAKNWFQNGIFSTIASDTHKGDVVHLAPPPESWQAAKTQAEIVAVVFPQYQSNIELDIYKLNQVQAFMQLAHNAFNFGVIGQDGFETLTKIIEQVPAFEVKYNELSQLVAFLEQEVLADAR